MSRLDEGFPPPTACVQWCQHRSYDLHVLDDGVEVDLDWWNGHLDRAAGGPNRSEKYSSRSSLAANCGTGKHSERGLTQGQSCCDGLSTS